VARLTPITVGGVVVTNATLHNEDYIKGIGNSGERIREDDHDIRDRRYRHRPARRRRHPAGARRGDGEAAGGCRAYEFPKTCPVCGSHAVREVNEKTGKVDSVTRCTGGFICRAQATEHLKHFVSRNAYDIEGLGSKQIDFFFESEDPSLQIRTAPDIFTLEKRQAASR
jgi:DNA ligase (NAD+)